MEYEYKISVVMAVYNAAPFLKEAVDSLISQDIGFENIQLIMVNDGSTDGSDIICNEYAEKYPDNIFPIHKENGGVASARNEGLQYAKGKYLNFMDSDDKFEVDAFRKMYVFFEEHIAETDIVTVPLIFFDAMTGAHWQNTKFKRGSRVIDLNKEPNTTLMFVNATLFSSQIKHKILFDSSLPCGEDIKVIYTLLMSKMTIGVVSDTCYRYRRRSVGGPSLIATAHGKKSWYFDYFYNLQFWMLDYYKQNLGYIPDFVKCVFASENQWRFRKDSNNLVQRKILNVEEFEQYKKLVRESIQEIDDKFLISEPFIYFEQKLFLLMFKYNIENAQLIRYNNQLLVGYNDCIVGNLSSVLLEICLVSEEDNVLTIEGMVTLPNIGVDYQIGYKVNDNFQAGEWLPYKIEEKVLDSIILTKRAFVIKIDLKDIDEANYIKFALKVDRDCVDLSNLQYKTTSRITNKYKDITLQTEKHIVYAEKHWISIIQANNTIKHKKNVALLKCLLHERKNKASLKAFCMRGILPILSKLKLKPIWIISDRYTKAGDNGEALFRYLQDKKQIKTYFLLFENSPDSNRLRDIGEIIEPYSWKHKIVHLLSDVIISSHADDFVINPFRGQAAPYQDILADKKFVFLQHGIIRNDISEWYNRLKINASLFITSAELEYDFVCSEIYLYNKKQVSLTGMPRYDLLKNEPDRIISIMPTWRAYLVEDWEDGSGNRKTKSGFKKSAYYKMYSELLNNVKLHEAAIKYNYKIQWIVHPNMKDTLNDFKLEDNIQIILNVEYRDIFSTSSLVITDYSSVDFDMAYLRKPVIYYQFDKEEFFSGAHTVKAGYFDYEKNGFGEVEYTVDKMVNRIIEYMNNDCKLKNKYRDRIDNFFAFDDFQNCKRVYDEILKLMQ